MSQYTIRVRGEKYLWGTSPCNYNFDLPVILHIQVDQFGEPVSLQTETKDGAASRKPYCQLRPGECFTFDLNGLSGVIGTCDLESNVLCTLLAQG